MNDIYHDERLFHRDIYNFEGEDPIPSYTGWGRDWVMGCSTDLR